jgi:hypothetical protein
MINYVNKVSITNLILVSLLYVVNMLSIGRIAAKKLGRLLPVGFLTLKTVVKLKLIVIDNALDINTKMGGAFNTKNVTLKIISIPPPMISKRNKKPHPVDQKNLTNLWNANSSEYGNDQTTKSKKVRIFNKQTTSNGRIVLDENTWIDFDYANEAPTKVHHKNESNIPKDTFILPKYPTLRGIISSLPDTESKYVKEELNDMDFFIVKGINEAVIWKNKNFEFLRGT